MKPAEVLKEMGELRETYKKQSFSFTKDQRTRYDELLKLRRERVNMFIKTGRVSKGGLRKKEEKQTDSES
tara:strand:- start:201 stop:410 length:210 start_codon:yes stop_codon:yes gene_type:complete